MTIDELKAAHPDVAAAIAADAAAAERAALAKPATVAELKAAFAADREFLLERFDANEPMAAHTAAYVVRLQQQLMDKDAKISELNQQLARVDPALAGLSEPLAVRYGDHAQTPPEGANMLHALADRAGPSVGRREDGGQ